MKEYACTAQQTCASIHVQQSTLIKWKKKIHEFKNKTRRLEKNEGFGNWGKGIRGDKVGFDQRTLYTFEILRQ